MEWIAFSENLRFGSKSSKDAGRLKPDQGESFRFQDLTRTTQKSQDELTGENKGIHPTNSDQSSRLSNCSRCPLMATFSVPPFRLSSSLGTILATARGPKMLIVG